MKTYIWLNCRGIDIVGIGKHKQDAFSKLNPLNRQGVLFCDKSVTYDQYPTTKRLFHNQRIVKY